jgi:hypothetical protein
MNREQAKAAIARDFNNAMKGQYDFVDPNALPLIEKILTDIGFEFTERAKENLTKANAISTGALADLSIPIVYKNNRGGYTLEVGYPIGSKQDKYYDFVNKGVKGTKNKKQNQGTPYSYKQGKKSIPVKPIQEWLNTGRAKNITYKKYRKLGTETKAIEGKKSLAFAIARGIHRDGLKATKYFDDALKILKSQDFLDALSVALEGDIIIQVNRIQKEK